MKVTHNLKYLFLLAGLFLFDACKDDDFEAPNGVKITFQARSMLKSAVDTVFLEEAYIGIGNIDLKRSGENDSSAIEKIVYIGPYRVDLLKGTVSPSIRWIFAEPGYYREIEIETHNTLTEGKTIILKGTIMPADGSGDIPFELITARDYTLNIKNNTGIEVKEGENVDLLVVFDLSDLFKGIDINSLGKNENGILVISEEAGANAVSLLVNKFDAFSSFGINDGLFPGNTTDENPGYEAPDADEDIGDEADGDTNEGESGLNPDDDNSGDDEGGGTDESGDNSDEGEVDNDSGDGAGDSGSNGDGTSDDDEEDENSGEAGNEGGPAGNGDSPVDGNGGTPGNGNEENSGNDDEEGSADEADDKGSDNEPGDEEGEDDSSNDGSNEDDSDDEEGIVEGAGNDEGENDDDDGNDDDVDNDDDRDDDGDDDDGDRDDDGDDDDDDRDDDDGGDDDDRDDDDDKNKDKDNSDKGNNGNSGGGKKK